MVAGEFVIPLKVTRLEDRFRHSPDSIPPALLLFGQILFGILVGGISLLLASPLIAVLMVLVKELYVKDLLERE